MSKITYCSGMPQITVDERGMLDLLDGNAVRTAMHVHADQPTGVAMVSFYHDDGFGNGNCILSIPLVELRALAVDYERRNNEAEAAAEEQNT